MKIREFHSRFSSVDESSSLFSVLRRLSLLGEIASMSLTELAWVEWPPATDPTDPTGPGMGLGPAHAQA
jgi:hypothetical protein